MAAVGSNGRAPAEASETAALTVRSRALRLTGPSGPSVALGAAYLATVPFDGLSVAGRSLPFWIGMALVATVAVDLASGRTLETDTKVPSFIPAVAAFLTLGAASFMWSTDPGSTLVKSITLANLGVTAGAAAFVLAGRPGLLRIYALSSAVFALLTIMSTPDPFDGRRSFAGNANDAAAFMAFGIALGAVAVTTTAGLRRIVWVGVLAITFTGVLATGSRSLLLGAGGSLLVVTVIEARRLRGRALALIVCSGAVVFVLLQRAGDVLVPERLFGIRSALEAGDFGNRRDLWRVALDYGPSAVGEGLGSSQQYLYAATGRAQVVHNVFIGVWLELGIAGVLFLGWLVVTALRGLRNPAWRPLVLCAIPPMLTAMMTLSVEERRVFWLFLATGWAAAMSVRDPWRRPPRPPSHVSGDDCDG